MRNKQISLDLFGDRFPWEGYDYSAGDNHISHDRLIKGLTAAIEHELTDCQRQVISAFYFEDKTVTVIAAELGVNKSTVSRHLQRARNKLRRCLQYGFYPDYRE